MWLNKVQLNKPRNSAQEGLSIVDDLLMKVSRSWLFLSHCECKLFGANPGQRKNALIFLKMDKRELNYQKIYKLSICCSSLAAIRLLSLRRNIFLPSADCQMNLAYNHVHYTRRHMVVPFEKACCSVRDYIYSACGLSNIPLALCIIWIAQLFSSRICSYNLSFLLLKIIHFCTFVLDHF